MHQTQSTAPTPGISLLGQGRCWFTFHGDLKDFLSGKKRRPKWCFSFKGKPSIKDCIEAAGVPHPEVRLILVDGHPVDFSFQIAAEHEIEVFPAHSGPRLPEHCYLPFLPQGTTKFALDVHLGNLARCLRMLGFDCHYEREDPGDAQIAAIGRRENRIVLTRDIGLLKRSSVIYGHWIRNRNPKHQLREVVAHYGLGPNQCLPFTRCMQCNQSLLQVDKQAVTDRVPAKVLREFEVFLGCANCGRIYWKGSHYHQMKLLLQDLWSVGAQGVVGAPA